MVAVGVDAHPRCRLDQFLGIEVRIRQLLRSGQWHGDRQPYGLDGEIAFVKHHIGEGLQHLLPHHRAGGPAELSLSDPGFRRIAPAVALAVRILFE